MSRSSVVYGPFSIVWGFGCVLLTAILYQYRTRSDGYIFLFGTRKSRMEVMLKTFEWQISYDLRCRTVSAVI